jgi:hypothetical protein
MKRIIISIVPVMLMASVTFAAEEASKQILFTTKERKKK